VSRTRPAGGTAPHPESTPGERPGQGSEAKPGRGPGAGDEPVGHRSSSRAGCPRDPAVQAGAPSEGAAAGWVGEPEVALVVTDGTVVAVAGDAQAAWPAAGVDADAWSQAAHLDGAVSVLRGEVAWEVVEGTDCQPYFVAGHFLDPLSGAIDGSGDAVVARAPRVVTVARVTSVGRIPPGAGRDPGKVISAVPPGATGVVGGEVEPAIRGAASVPGRRGRPLTPIRVPEAALVVSESATDSRLLRIEWAEVGLLAPPKASPEAPLGEPADARRDSAELAAPGSDRPGPLASPAPLGSGPGSWSPAGSLGLRPAPLGEWLVGLGVACSPGSAPALGPGSGDRGGPRGARPTGGEPADDGRFRVGCDLWERADGTAAALEVWWAPLRGSDREPTGTWVVLLRDVTAEGPPEWAERSAKQASAASAVAATQAAAEAARREAEEERQRAEWARAAAESHTARLALLARAATLLSASLDPDHAVERLARLLVPELGDACVVHVVDGEGELRRTVVWHREPAETRRLQAAVAARPLDLTVPGLLRDVLRGGPATALAVPPAEDGALALLAGSLPTGAVARTLVVPLRARGRTLATLTLVAGRRRTYGEDDLELVADLARRAALGIDNARLYQREHRVAEALQQVLLPAALPRVTGLSVAARYLPATDGVEVGGDFYDLLVLPDDRVMLVVGDVEGHDLRAAALMGQLRYAIRAYAWQGDGPGRILGRLDRLMAGAEEVALATVVVALLESEGRELRYAVAGHPPLLLVGDGGAVALDEPRSMPVGVGLAPEFYPEGVAQLSVGDVILAYTDGLVEQRDGDLPARIALLGRVGERVRSCDPEAICDEVLASLLTEERSDDVALVALSVTGRGSGCHPDVHCERTAPGGAVGSALRPSPPEAPGAPPGPPAT